MDLNQTALNIMNEFDNGNKETKDQILSTLSGLLGVLMEHSDRKNPQLQQMLKEEYYKDKGMKEEY